MIIDAYSMHIGTDNGCSVYRTELRAKNQLKTAFGSRQNIQKLAINNSFTNAEVMTSSKNNDYYDNILMIRIFDESMQMYHEFPISMAYFIKSLLVHCEGSAIKAELAYVPKFGVILKSESAYKEWEESYLKEYTELGQRRTGSGLYNGKRTANKPEVLYFNDYGLIEYIGRFTVPEDITQTSKVRNPWQNQTVPVVIVPAGKYYVYIEKSLGYPSVEIKLTTTPRKLNAVVDDNSKLLKRFPKAVMNHFFYDSLIGGWPWRKDHTGKSIEVVPRIITSSSYRSLSLNEIVIDLSKSEIRNQ